MAAGSLLLPLSFLVLGTMQGGAALSTALLGVSFACLPAILWPTVVRYSPAEYLGTAYGLMTTLQNFADATGGRAFFDSNDLQRGFREAVEDNSDYYMLGYYLDTKNNILTMSDGTKIDTVTGLKITA